jgi:nitrogen fixation/metabolism regulation signal transduction histidine kinase
MGTVVGVTVTEVLDVLDVGVGVVGADGRLVQANRALPELLGLTVPGMLPGRAVTDIADALNAQGAHAAAAALAWPPSVHPQQRRLAGGRSVQAAWHRLEAGWVLVLRDVTIQAQVRRRLREHNRALAEKLAAARRHAADGHGGGRRRGGGGAAERGPGRAAPLSRTAN